MKTIQIEDDLYQYIASQTQDIGESASNILRRLLLIQQEQSPATAIELTALTEPANTVAVTNDLKVTDSPSKDEVKQAAETVVDGNVFDVLNKEEVMTQKGAVGRFLFILAALYRCHNKKFNKVLEIKGRERHYFGETAEELEASGSSIKPKQIPDSHYWVVTNNNTPRKKLIITEVATALGYQQSQVEALRELI